MAIKIQMLLHQLKNKLPGEIYLEPATLEKYAGDKWFAAHPPDAVALPRSAKNVAANAGGRARGIDLPGGGLVRRSLEPARTRRTGTNSSARRKPVHGCSWTR